MGDAVAVVRVLVVLMIALMASPASAQRRPSPRVASMAVLPALPGGADTSGTGRSLDVLQDEGSGRYTKQGLIVGALAGGLGGLGFGTLLGLFCEAEGDGCWGAVPIITLIGAAGGGAAGAIIGAAIPRRRTPRDTSAAPPVRERPRRIGSFEIVLGRAHATIHGATSTPFRGVGPEFRANLFAELRPWIAIGPEVGQAWFDEGGNIRHAGVTLRTTWSRRTISPYAALNLGAWQTTAPSLEFFGGSFGAGARISPLADAPFFADVEARYSRNLHNIEPMRMKSLSFGVGFTW